MKRMWNTANLKQIFELLDCTCVLIGNQLLVVGNGKHFDVRLQYGEIVASQRGEQKTGALVDLEDVNIKTMVSICKCFLTEDCLKDIIKYDEYGEPHIQNSKGDWVSESCYC